MQVKVHGYKYNVYIKLVKINKYEGGRSSGVKLVCGMLGGLSCPIRQTPRYPWTF